MPRLFLRLWLNCKAFLTQKVVQMVYHSNPEKSV